MTRSPFLHPRLVALEQVGVTHPLCRERALCVCVCECIQVLHYFVKRKNEHKNEKKRNEKEAGERFLASTHLTAH